MDCPANVQRRTPLQNRWLATFVFSTLALQAFAQTTPALEDVAAFKLRPLEVTVNGAVAGDWVLLERGGVLYAPKMAFQEWRVLLRPDAPSVDFRGQPYFSLSAVAGYEAKTDFATQSLALTFSARSFESTQQEEARAAKQKPDKVLPSVFFNYDLNLALNKSTRSSTSRDLGALTEVGVSTNAGVLTSSAVGRGLLSNGAGSLPASWSRLETTFTRNFPETNRTLRVGDSVTRGSLLGRNAYFGGVQYGSNFALTPGFISQPLPTISGLSSAPSTVDLYVNNVLRQTSNVPTGPFTLTNLPTFNGSGDARLVVRDLLGRETVIVQPFFSNSQLLAVGLSDWSIEAGALRRDLGISSANYGGGFASGTYKYGVRSDLTVEGRAEVARDLQAASLGAVAVLAGSVLGRAAVMSSRSPSFGAGNQWLLGADYAGATRSAGIQLQGATLNFRQLGIDQQTPPVRYQLSGNASYYTESKNSLSAGFAIVDRFDGQRVSTFSVGYSMRAFNRGSLQISVGRAITSVAVNSLVMTLVMPLEANAVSSAGVELRAGQNSAYTSATSNPSENDVVGWRVLAAQNQASTRAEAGLNYASRYARLSGDVSQSAGQTALRMGASGGLLATDGQVFASQRINDSFALVEVPGFPNLSVSLGATALGKTNADGVAIVPRLLPYQVNAIRLNANELPISAEIDNIELTTVPASRSGVKLVFATRAGRAALLRLVLDDGQAAPAGATLQVQGQSQEFYVARRGEAFVTGLLASSRITLTWKAQQCVMEVALPPLVRDDIARVGPLVCKGVAR